MSVQLVVLAKAPVAGSVKTRLCPPCNSEQAAAVAAAALADTLDVVSATPAARRALVLSGGYDTPHGWTVLPQRGVGLAERLAHAFADTALPGTTTVLVGMDTPQLDPGLLGDVVSGLTRADAVLGPAEDGGWWTLALRDPRHATALRAVSMSTPDTYHRTVRALRARGLSVAAAPTLRDVDTAEDAWAVAQVVPDGRFAQAVQAHVPGHSRPR